MARTRIASVIALVLFMLGMGVVSVVSDRQYMLISLALVAAAMVPFFVRFELRSVQSREIVLVAALAAIAAVSRVPFAPLPSVQPTTFVVIVSALVFGAETGFLIGAFAAVVSNLFLGQGPWTPWQMFAWGAIGWMAGWLNRRGGLACRKIILLGYGFISGIVFGWIMNFWMISSSFAETSWAGVVAIYASSIYFDLAHALSNVVFLALFANVWIKVLQRFKIKYGLLDGRSEAIKSIE